MARNYSFSNNIYDRLAHCCRAVIDAVAGEMPEAVIDVAAGGEMPEGSVPFQVGCGILLTVAMRM